MKLLSQTTRYYAWAFLAVLFFYTGISYFSITYFVHLRMEKALLKEFRVIERVIHSKDSIVPFPGFGENELEIFKAHSHNSKGPQFKTVEIYSKREEATLDYFELSAPIQTMENVYGVHIRRSMVRANDLVSSLILSGFLLLVFLFLGLSYFNKRINQRIWGPFYQTLGKLKDFDLLSGKKIEFEPSRTKEFDELNQELNVLTEKIYQDYQAQKHFVENASHELQTPLAVIKSQLELLIQSEKIGESEFQLVSSALDAADRLTQLNKSLIMLSRIENLQFTAKTDVSINRVILQNLKIFNIEASSKGIQVFREERGHCRLNMNEALAHIIVRNLIQNAIRHNIENGRAWVIIEESSLTVRNTGIEGAIDTGKAFERFYKQSDSEGSLGLGLPMVKQICDLNGFIIDYTVDKNIHTIHIDFSVLGQPEG